MDVTPATHTRGKYGTGILLNFREMHRKRTEIRSMRRHHPVPHQDGSLSVLGYAGRSNFCLCEEDEAQIVAQSRVSVDELDCAPSSYVRIWFTTQKWSAMHQP